MFEYCTLQEAYNVPSFEASRKKRSAGCAPKIAQPSPSERSGREQARYGGSNVEEFEDARMGHRERVTYRNQAADYKYYNNEYALRLPEVETFSTSQQCAATAPQRYEIPISKEAKAEYDSAMNTALSQTTSSTKPFTPDTRKVDMSGVTGYYDEDMEQYLTSANFAKSDSIAPAPTPVVPRASGTTDATPYDPSESPLRKFTPTPVPAPSPWWDIAIFVLAGLLIMFLCEQLFKLAVMIGMRRTVDILEPYLSQIAK